MYIVNYYYYYYLLFNFLLSFFFFFSFYPDIKEVFFLRKNLLFRDNNDCYCRICVFVSSGIVKGELVFNLV